MATSNPEQAAPVTGEVDALIARLEAATGPDRELDAEIYRVAFGAKVWSYDDNAHIDHMIKRGIIKGPREAHPDYDPEPEVTWRFHRGDVGTTTSEYGEVPKLTESIDAALTLAADPLEVLARALESILARIRSGGWKSGSEVTESDIARPIAAEALKARASQPQPERE